MVAINRSALFADVRTVFASKDAIHFLSSHGINTLHALIHHWTKAALEFLPDSTEAIVSDIVAGAEASGFTLLNIMPPAQFTNWHDEKFTTFSLPTIAVLRYLWNKEQIRSFGDLCQHSWHGLQEKLINNPRKRGYKNADVTTIVCMIEAGLALVGRSLRVPG